MMRVFLWTNNNSILSKIRNVCSRIGKRNRFNVIKREFAFGSHRVEYIDFIEVERTDKGFAIKICYDASHVFDFHSVTVRSGVDGSCLNFKKSTWIIKLINSLNLASLFDEFDLCVSYTAKGANCSFSAKDLGWVFTQTPNGMRWINPTSKSILMPCDGRGGGPPLSKSLIKRWKRFDKHELAGKIKQRFRVRLVAQQKRVSRASFGNNASWILNGQFEPQMDPTIPKPKCLWCVGPSLKNPPLRNNYVCPSCCKANNFCVECKQICEVKHDPRCVLSTGIDYLENLCKDCAQMNCPSCVGGAYKFWTSFQPQMVASLLESISNTPSTLASIVSGIGDVTRAIHSTAVNGVGVSEQVTARLDALTSELGRFNDLAENVNEDGVKIKHTHSLDIGSLLSWCVRHKETIGMIVIIFMIFYLSRKGCNAALASALVGMATALVVHFAPDLQSIWDRFAPNLSEPVCVFEAQFLDNPALRSALLLSYIFGFRGVCVETLTSRFDKFCSILREAPRRTGDITDTIGYYLKSLQDLFNQTLAWCGVDYSINLAPDKYPASTTLLNEVSEFLKTSSSCKDLAVEKAARVSQVLQARISDMLVKNKSDHEFSGDRVLLMRAQAKLENYDRELDLRGAGRDVTRVPPKAYLFIGQPKIGKSYLLKSLSYMALYTLLKDNETALGHIRNNQLRDYIFTRNSCDKFWEGYYNQMLVLLDEVGMQRDQAGSDAETNEYANFIKMVNDVVFPLLMANVEKKGTREFNSPVIFGTTNLKHFRIESITNTSAYDRRWNAFEVTVKAEYGKWFYGHGGSDDWIVPDFDLMREKGMSEEDIALSRFLEFRPRVSLMSPGYKGPAISIDDLIRGIQSDLSDRDSEIKSRQRQSELLHNFFDPSKKESTPGSFEPQSFDCWCKVCQNSESRFFSDEELFRYGEVVKNILPNQIHAVFQNGYDKVVDENSYLYDAQPECLMKTLEKHPTWNDVQIMFQHGVNVKSVYVKSLDLTGRRAKIDTIKSIATKALAALGVLGSIFAVYKIGKALFGAEATEENDPFVAQYIDLNAQEVMSCVLNRNVYSIGDDVTNHRGFITFVADNICVMPYHYVLHWQKQLETNPDFHVSLRRLGDKVNHQVIRFHVKHMLSDVYKADDNDFVAIYVGGRVVQRHASLRKYLVSTSDGSMRTKGEALFPVVDKVSLKVNLATAPYEFSNTVRYPASGKILSVETPITYRYKTVTGDCGLPVGVKDPLSRCQKIYGIHVTGAPNLGIGCSVLLSQSKFDRIVEHFEKKFSLIQAQYRTDGNVVLEMQNEGKDWNDLYAVPEHMEIPGKVNLGIAQPAPVPVKTAIVPSPLFKRVGFPPRTKPARLRAFENKMGELIDPNKLTTLKYHRTISALDLDVLDVCKNDVTNLIVNGNMLRHHEAIRRAPLDFDVAVAGMPGVEGLDGIPRKTSAGYPRCLSVKKRGKRDFFGDEGDYDLRGMGACQIRAAVNELIARAKLGIRGFHLFFDFPKDERRPSEKVDAGKTRKISACPIDLAIAIRMYFGEFIQDFMYNRVYNQSALGVNVFDSQWDLIARYLGENNRIIAGDFGNYDGTLPYCIMVRFLDTVTAWYGDAGSENERIREVLFQELVNSRHIMDGVIYEWVGSNASGNPLTTVLNSWCNLVLLRYATLKVVGKCNVREGSKFLRSSDDFLRFMVYGDDNLISVNRNCQYADLLTQENYTKAFEEMGFEYTDEMKGSGPVKQDRGITEVSFLKRKWEENSNDTRRKYLSPLALETILESIQWTKKKDFDFEHVKENCVNMLQELSQHDRKVFEEWAPKIISACKSEMNFVPIPNTYDECQSLVLARDSFM